MKSSLMSGLPKRFFCASAMCRWVGPTCFKYCTEPHAPMTPLGDEPVKHDECTSSEKAVTLLRASVLNLLCCAGCCEAGTSSSAGIKLNRSNT